MIDPSDEPTWPPMNGDERTLLDGFLDGYRTVLARKAAGLDREQLATSVAASPLTLGGLVKHMALVEDIWFTQAMAGDPPPEPWASVDWEADRDWELHSAGSDAPDELFGLFTTAVERSRSVTSRFDDLDTPAAQRSPDGEVTTLRWIYVHMIEEYARHCGHADLIRESIDGTVGD